MKTIKVTSEAWFKKAPFHDIKMLGIKHLGIPADRFENKQAEAFKRALVRQVYTKDHQYGEDFEITEPVNPFGTPKKRVRLGEALKGDYAFVKNGLRAPDGDVRHTMMEYLQRFTTFESVIQAWDADHEEKTFKSTGALTFTFQGFIGWALKRCWIIRV
jgi:hypothetical protein